MPKAHPVEFRRDVVAVARKREAPLSQIAKDFGISESCLSSWLKKADVEDGVDAVDPNKDPEAYLLEAATSLDISGRHPHRWPSPVLAEIIAKYPRLDLASRFTSCFQDQGRRKPKSQQPQPSVEESPTEFRRTHKTAESDSGLPPG